MLLHQVITSCMSIIDPKIKMDLIDTTISRFKKEVLMKALKDQSNQKYYSDISLSMELLHNEYGCIDRALDILKQRIAKEPSLSLERGRVPHVLNNITFTLIYTPMESFNDIRL